MSLLPAEPLYLGYGNTLDADGVQGVFYFVQFKRLDDGLNFFMNAASCSVFLQF